jgi:hypothetical protein
MSKAVKAVGNAIGSVVKGAVKAVKSVVKGVGTVVKKVASSKLGKAVLIAAAVYFGGAALAGGFGSSAAGGSFLSGMGTGVANAASSLSTAWGSALSGNFSTAGSQLAQGFSGNAAVAASPTNVMAGNYAVTGQAAGGTAAGGGAAAGGTAAGGGAAAGGTAAGGTAAGGGAAGTPGMMSKILASPYTAPALISGGMQVGGAYIQGKAQEKQIADQRKYEEDQTTKARNLYNTNVGTELWSPNQQAVYQDPYAGPWDPYAEARALAEQQRFGRINRRGLVSQYMPQPST